MPIEHFPSGRLKPTAIVISGSNAVAVDPAGFEQRPRSLALPLANRTHVGPSCAHDFTSTTCMAWRPCMATGAPVYGPAGDASCSAPSSAAAAHGFLR